MKVLLISANTEQLNMPVLPLGPACVAAAATGAGHEVRLVNPMTKDGVSEILRNAIAGFCPEVIGISVRNIDDQSMRSPRFLLEPVKKIVADCRSMTPVPIVLGGAGYSIYPRSALELLGADMGIQGEGEAAFLMLLERLSRKNDLSGVPGLVQSGFANKAQPIRKLDRFTLPVPEAVSSFPQKFNGQKVWLPFQTRRGCPMGCSYCSTASIEGKTMRMRSPDRVIESISRFADAGFSHFFFVDNTFNLPISYAKDLCEQLAAKGPRIRWRCILYPWKADEELVEKMARAGCVEVSFGFESGVVEILRSMNKRFGPAEVISISRLLDKYEIGRIGFLLLGGPGETRQTVEKSLAFADSLDLESMKVTTGIRIYPNTRLAEIALREGALSAGSDLLFPTFYLARGLEGWIQETVSEWMSTRPHWIC